MLFQLLVAIIGLLLWLLSSNPKVQHIGDVLFWTATLAFLFSVKVPILGH